MIIFMSKKMGVLLAGGFIVLNVFFLPSLVATSQAAPVADVECASYIQNKVVWDNADKSISWPRKYVTKICKGVKIATYKEPGVCHTTVQRGRAWNTTRNLKGQKSWGPIQVAGLCEGTDDGGARAACFESEAAKNGWAKAIKACKKITP